MQIRSRAAIAASLLGALALSACAPGGASGGEASDENTIHIVGFAVPEAANKNIASEYALTDAGKGVKFETSFGPSGDQSRAVAAGLDADYVHFSVPTEVTRLVDEGLVADDWDSPDCSVAACLRRGRSRGRRPSSGSSTPSWLRPSERHQ